MPGDPTDSPLLERVAAKDPEYRMPPEGPPLSEMQVAAIRDWIKQGANTPTDEQPEPDPRDHWAFRSPLRPAVLAAGNPIDVLLSHEWNTRKLLPSPPAEKATLLRRVTLDLIGLPPTREELTAFLADESPDAYEKVVDRLLADPRHGERWARHWMDVWRYSDWYGRRSVPDVMNSYPMIWRWRDWIVRSLNADKGYDRMILEMLAADELAPADDANLVATGFLVRNWFKWNYNQWMRDAVEHTGKAFLGLTLNCCHCHDHKYDPITQHEYFRFRAFFEPLELRHDRVPGEPDPGPFKKYVYTQTYGPITSGMIRVFDEKPDAVTLAYTGGDERNKITDGPPVTPGAPAALGGGNLAIHPVDLPRTVWYPGLKDFVRQEELAQRESALVQAEAAATQARIDLEQLLRLMPERVIAGPTWWATRVAEAKLVAAKAERDWVKARLAADEAVYFSFAANALKLAKAASQAERIYQHAAAELAAVQAEQKAAFNQKALPAAIAARKQVEEKAKQLAVDSITYTPFAPIYPKQSSGRRLALARWIADPQNPLTARVGVNHIWKWHFGRPLVETTHDFGRNGKPPTHPALLDWLAVEFVENGWSHKHLHKLIVTSQAYRMQSDQPPPDDPRIAADPDNVYLWRFPTQRMEAETVRDSVLYLAGELDATRGGPEIPHEHGLTSKRRSLYFAHHGEGKMEFLELFDAANPCDCYRRTTSIMPQQALALINSELVRHCGRTLAGKLGGTDTAAFVRAAFEQVLGRPPTHAEFTAAEGFLTRQATTLKDDQRARENLVIALFNHNDFVTVR
jgi:hypothetical protein